MSDPTFASTNESNAWDSRRAYWHIGFVSVLGVSAVVAAIDGEASPANRIASVAMAAVLGLHYAVFGRPLSLTPERSLGRSLAYMIPAVLLTAALLLLNPVFFVLLWVVFPQMFATSPDLRWGIIASGLLCVAWVVSSARWADAPFTAGDAWRSGLLQAAVGFASSVALGWWIFRIIEESRSRAALIEELAITRTQLAEVHHEAGMLAERDRLAGEIHDTLAQGFTSIVMLLQAADHELERDPSTARKHLASAERTARENLSEARALIGALQPVGLQSATLAEAIKRIARRCHEDTGLVVDVEIIGDVRLLQPNEEVALLRSAQEALSNVRKHARASSVRMALRYGAETTTLTVADDGRGFDPTAASAGYGLKGLRSRLDQAGGHAEVRSRPGEGTTVEVSMP